MAADRQLCRNSSGSESPEEVTRMEIERPEVSADGDSLQSGIKETSNLRRSNSAPMFNGPNMGYVNVFISCSRIGSLWKPVLLS